MMMIMTNQRFWWTWTLQGLIWTLLLTLCKGTFECRCTTQACKQEQRETCTAEHFCYVQYLARGDSTTGEHPLVWGCIDTRNPLLCENRRPKSFQGPWPVLHCCKESFCNKDVIPTIPPWLIELQSNTTKPKKSVKEQNPKPAVSTNTRDYNTFQEPEDIYYPESDKRRTINPIYIAVPIAGACLLLAIIIFAIYVLKRQNRYYDEYRYHGNLQNGAPPLAKELVVDSNNKSDRNTNTNVNTNATNTNRYSDSERSSSGSESKLLMKV